MKLYSPSSRQDFSFCPRYWWLRKRYVTKRVGYPELCAVGGKAVAEAMARWHGCQLVNVPIAEDTLVGVGLQSVTQQLAEFSYIGRVIEGEKDRTFTDTLPKLVESGVRVLWEASLFKQHVIIAVEHEFTEWGKARPDLISRDPMGRLVVDDYKVKFGEFKEEWLEGEFDKHFNGEQRVQYTGLAGTDLFGIVLVILKPSKDRKTKAPMVIRRTSVVKDYERARWKHDSILDYQRMEVVEQALTPEQVPGKASPHATQYGDCVFKQACLDYELKPELIQLDYLPLPQEGPNGKI